MARNELITRYLDFSGGLQTATSRLLMKDNELSKAQNARYDKKIGGVTRKAGYEIVGNPVEHGKAIKGGNSFFQKDGNNKLLVSVNNSNDSNATIRYENEPFWNNVLTNLPASSKVEFENFLDQAFIVGYSESEDSYLQPQTINGSLNVSTTDHVYNAPRGKYILKYADKLYIANCSISGKKYPDRLYQSSAPTDSVTFVNTDQKELLWQLKVDSVRYLKAGMKIDIYGENSNQKKVDSLEIISVNKAENIISFSPVQIDVKDRDEIYLEDKKGTLIILWNTDYPNPDSSDFLTIPPVKNEVPKITGIGSANNRLFIFTEHSFWKWDGANLVNISKTIGTTSHSSISEMRGWLVFLHKTGIWGYNDEEGKLQLLSRGIQNYIDAINQVNFYKAVGIAHGDIYKLNVGELAEIDSRTTSTSTSSTSTSSTSSSTSSTSTSSTSTSSTSTSLSGTTSISTSSTSTSSTSSSISTSSTSTSSTSTSTTTVAPTVKSTILVYDFSSNTWAVDTLNRNLTTAFLHQMHGYEKIYFGDDTGRFYRDETGLDDNGFPIQFLIETKRFHLNLPEETKTFRRIYVYSQGGQQASFSVSYDGGEFETLGQLNKNVTSFDLGEKRARDISFRVSQNNSGEPVVFLGVGIVWLRGELYATSKI